MIYAFDTFLLNTERRELRGHGKTLNIGRRAFDMLQYLIENRDRVLSNEELLLSVWAKTAVEKNNLTVTMSALRRILGDQQGDAVYIRTVPGLGYQFVGTLQTGAAHVPGTMSQGFPGAALPELPAIAVLPFRQITSNPNDTHFVHGLAQDIISELSRNRWLTVISSNSSSTFTDSRFDTRQIARELNVHYLLEGTLRTTDNRLRVTTRLIEGATGRNLTSDRYDRAISCIFAVQDEIAWSIVTSIRPVLSEAEQARSFRRHPNSTDAWIAYQCGVREFSDPDQAKCQGARVWFERAISFDPYFAPGYYGLSLVHLHAGSAYLSSAAPDWQRQGEILAEKAVTLDPRDSGAHSILGLSRLLRGDHAGALEATAQALALNPSDATALGTEGATLVFCGRPEDGLQSLARSIRLSPRDPRLHIRLSHVGLGQYFANQFDEALETASVLSRHWPDYSFPPRLVAMVLAEIGDVGGARRSLQAARALSGAPFDNFSLARMPWYGAEAFKRARASLSLAGLDEFS